MSFGPITLTWIAVGIAALAFAGWTLASGGVTSWTWPALIGGVASVLAGFYQAWWEHNVFEALPEDRRGITTASTRSP